MSQEGSDTSIYSYGENIHQSEGGTDIVCKDVQNLKSHLAVRHNERKAA